MSVEQRKKPVIRGEDAQRFLENEKRVDEIRNCLLICKQFGNLDGMVGSCVDCSYNNEELFNKCWEYSHRR
jgi:hypothetical protein